MIHLLSPVHRVLLGGLFVTLLTLTACAPTPERETPPAASTINAEIAARETAADPAVNARHLLERAAGLTGEPHTLYLLRAAELFLQAGDDNAARATLRQLTGQTLTPIAELRKQLIDGWLELRAGRTEPALRINLPAVQIPVNLGISYHRLRAEALAKQGNSLASASERVLLDTLLSDPRTIEANQRALLDTLLLMSPRALEQLATSATPPLAGWLALAATLKRNGHDETALAQALYDWRRSYPNHPLRLPLNVASMSAMMPSLQAPGQIAVLLPASGKFARPASIIRQGLLAAYYNDGSDKRPVIRFHDSSQSGEIQAAYQQAIATGADFIIGPLTRQAVADLAGDEVLKIPVLALNYLPDTDSVLHANLFQYGLSPEQEARQVAERAVFDSHPRMVVLAPDNAWGRRVEAAFGERLDTLGGTLLETHYYNPADKDHSAGVAQLLNIDESKQRYRQLKDTLGEQLEFETRRRQDVDAVFVIARPRDGRLLRPLLQFHHASGLPVYATSSIHSPGAPPDPDLNGVIFADLPWLLEVAMPGTLPRNQVELLWKDIRGAQQRLFAMGMESYRLVTELARLTAGVQESYEGYTGSLWLSAEGRIQRQMLWAKYSHGTPAIIGYAPRFDTAGHEILPAAGETGTDSPASGASSPDHSPVQPQPSDGSG